MVFVGCSEPAALLSPLVHETVGSGLGGPQGGFLSSCLGDRLWERLLEGASHSRHHSARGGARDLGRHEGVGAGVTCYPVISEVRAREEADLAERQGHQEESRRAWAANFLLLYLEV